MSFATQQESPLAAPDRSLEGAFDEIGQEMYGLIRQLYPICRSITGHGVRRTLDILRQHIEIAVHEVPTGTPVFDWTVPREWNIRDAYIADGQGRRRVDFQACNLHVVSYSTPVARRMTRAELRPHVHTIPDRPDLIPYRTSYYNETWGFCMSHRQWLELEEGEYEVVIDSTLAPGALTYGECFVPGATSEEVLISCHICHPSLCNDNLSGIVLATMLARRQRQRQLRYGYRFLFVPGTIGSITWLSRNEDHLHRIRHGLVAVCLGDAGGMTYKRSRHGRATIDRAVEHVLRASGDVHRIIDFFPYGYDERQYCSPGFDLPVGCLMRTPHGEYPEYHTSADDLACVRPASLADSWGKIVQVLDLLEANRCYRSLNPKCEPQLGKRGLYHALGGRPDAAQLQMALLWVLNLADERHTLLDMAERSGLPFETLVQAAELLKSHELLIEVSDESHHHQANGPGA